MKPVFVVALIGGACVTSPLGGACAALTAIPPGVMLATGLALCAIAFTSSATCLPTAMLGSLLGLMLPATAPLPAGKVVTRSVGSAFHGDLFEVLDQLDDRPSQVLGHRVVVSGEWMPAATNRLATVSRRVMNCCAADAVAVGFDVRLSRGKNIPMHSWVRVEGVINERTSDGDQRFVLEQSRVTGLEDTGVSAR